MNTSEIPLWITATHWASRSVLVVLALLSVWSIATMIRCYRLIQNAAGGAGAGELFTQIQNLIRDGKITEILHLAGEPNLYQQVVREAAANVSQDPSRIDRAIKSLLTLRRTEIERGLTVLATLGSNAPFIGLFGTVLGIIQAFGALGNTQGGGSSVMVAISEALIATAVGLFVAIPAVVAFNFLSRYLRVLLTNCEALRDLYIARLKVD